MASTSPTTRNTLAYAGASLLILALILIGLYYAVYAPIRMELADARQQTAASMDETAAAKRRIAELEALNARQGAEMADLNALLSDLRETGAALETSMRARETELALAQQMQNDLVAALQQEIASGQIRVERMVDSLRVDLVNEILFDSGEATLKPEGMGVLNRLGEVLGQAMDRLVVVQGHTDSVQIGSRLSQRYATNWELSAARAVNVTRYLQEQVGIDPRRLSASGFSEYRPREDNSTPEGRQKNRRIEILLAPLPETSFAQPIPNVTE